MIRFQSAPRDLTPFAIMAFLCTRTQELFCAFNPCTRSYVGDLVVR
jgi:hypothetical protein